MVVTSKGSDVYELRTYEVHLPSTTTLHLKAFANHVPQLICAAKVQ